MKKTMLYTVLLASFVASHAHAIQPQEEETTISALSESSDEMPSNSGVAEPKMPVVQNTMLTPAQIASQAPVVAEELGENPRIYQETAYPAESCPLRQKESNEE